jgi:hypothetical protein
MRLLIIRSIRGLKNLGHTLLGFYYRQRLYWSFKGKKDHFENYIKFQGTLPHAKFTWEEGLFYNSYERNEDLDQIVIAGGKQAMLEFEKIKPIALMDVKDKKTVRQTIKDSILELKNMSEMGLPQ